MAAKPKKKAAVKKTAKKATVKKKAVAKKAPAKKVAKKAAAKKVVKKAAAKKTVKKAAAKKTTTKKKAVAKKAPAKKVTAKKAAAKKTTAKKAVAKKPAAKKAVAKKAVAKKTTAKKKAAAKKSTAKKKAGGKKSGAKSSSIPGRDVMASVAARVQQIVAPAAPAPAPRPIVDNGKLKAEIAATKKTFKVDDYVVYPTHGVGFITGIEEQEVAGLSMELFVILFEKEKMTLRVPITKANSAGMRRLSSPAIMDNAMTTLKGRARIKRTMWSRRAQEYEAKIKSGDPISIAEVVRDLHRSGGQPEQSYSERQIYEAALDRLSRELAAVESLNPDEAHQKLYNVLNPAPQPVAGEETAEA